tara:strand:+ start:910 stop:1659 length:750 start_codon:yes stop_codon:yes gene_type:complete
MKVLNRFNELQINPKAILFDTDNTLYDYEPANKAAEKAAQKRAKELLGISEDIFKEFYFQAKKDVKQTLGKTASSHSRLLYFKSMLELLGTRAELQIALDLEHTFWREFLNNAILFESVSDLLILLRNLKIPIGVVTDLNAHIQLRKLAYFGLQDTFDAIVTSEEAGADKPDKRNFILMAKKLNIESLEKVWMIGDNPYADILGAKSVGSIAIQKIHKGIEIGKNDQEPDALIYGFNLFLKHMKKINNR